jgi:hypothetical protein
MIMGDPRSHFTITVIKPTIRARVVGWLKEYVPVILMLLLQAFGIALMMYGFASLLRR